MKRYRLMPSVSGFWGGFAARMMSQRDAARKENARLRQTLEFYANKSSYAEYYDSDYVKYGERGQTLVGDDAGKLAREALGIDD